jgi:molybdopterin synthase sulfur carrier subunit
MAESASSHEASGGTVLVRYWAGARAAAGVAEETYPAPTTLDSLLDQIAARHRGRPRLQDVVGVCSVLVGDRPVSSSDPADVALVPGDTVELLPPFAGG